MTALDPNLAEEFAALEERYWKALQTTLELVFEAGPGLAAHYRRGLMKAPPLQRALALHDDPLDIASTLTGKSLTADRVALYDAIMRSSAETKRAAPDDILSLSRRDESAPLVTVKTLNEFMGELGYDRLTIRSGTAYFLLSKKARKQPLPRRHNMQTLPGLTADREEVYGLDRILNLLNGLQEFARQRQPTSSIITRIERLKARLLLAHSSRHER